MQTDYNPKWLAFLTEEGLTTEQAEAMDRPSRISLNAKFLCWGVERMPSGRRKLFFE